MLTIEQIAQRDGITLVPSTNRPEDINANPASAALTWAYSSAQAIASGRTPLGIDDMLTNQRQNGWGLPDGVPSDIYHNYAMHAEHYLRELTPLWAEELAATEDQSPEGENMVLPSAPEFSTSGWVASIEEATNAEALQHIQAHQLLDIQKLLRTQNDTLWQILDALAKR